MGFNGGKEWTPEVEGKLIELASKPYIKRISILGGEPLADENIDGVLNLVNKIRLSLPQKTIWIYSGYTWETIINYRMEFSSNNIMKIPNCEILYDYHMFQRKQIISQCSVMVDGRYIDSQRDINLAYRGSSNQRIIDIKKSLEHNEVILYCD